MQPRLAITALVDGCRCLSLVVLIATAAALPAQVPPGWAVVSSFHSRTTGPGGLEMVHPAVPGAPVPITGLSSQLTGPAPGGFLIGAASVLVDPNGRVIVGEHTPPGHSTEIHVLTLNGTAVASSLAYTVGTGSSAVWIDQMAWLGDDIVFSVRGGNLNSGPFANQMVGILRPYLGPPGTTGTLVPVPITFNPAGTVNALAVDPVGGVAFFAKFLSSGMTDVYSLPVPGSATPVAPNLVVTVNATVLNLAWRNGRLLFAGFDTVGPYLSEIDPQANPVAVTVLPTGSLGSLNGITVETATGNLLVADDSANTIERLVAGINIQIASGLTGVPTGVAVNPSLSTYGTATSGANTYEWQIAPNAGGLPLVGNTAFSITLASSPGTAPGLLGLSLGRAVIPLPGQGVTLLLDPTTLVIQGLLPAQSPATVPVPIPAVPAFAGLSLYAQAGYFEPGAVATSDGLKITVF